MAAAFTAFDTQKVTLVRGIKGFLLSHWILQKQNMKKCVKKIVKIVEIVWKCKNNHTITQIHTHTPGC